MGLGSKLHDGPHGFEISVAFVDANRGGDLGYHCQVSCQAWGTGLALLAQNWPSWLQTKPATQAGWAAGQAV